MTVTTAIAALIGMLQRHIDASVFLGLPDDAVPGVYVWPWLIEEDADLKYQRSNQQINRADTRRFSAGSAMDLHLLIFVRPALTLGGLATLDVLSRAMETSPVLTVEEERLTLRLQTLSLDQLSSLFIAAGLRWTVCLGVALGPVMYTTAAPLEPPVITR